MLHFLAVLFLLWFCLEIFGYALWLLAFLLALSSGKPVYYTFQEFSTMFFLTPPQKMVIFAALLSAVVTWYTNRQAYQKLGINKTPFFANQKVVFKLNLPFEETFALCMDSLKNLEKPYKIKCSDENTGTIRLITVGNNMFSRGMLVVFQIIKMSNDQTQILLTSNVRTLITLADCAKNYKNVKAIIDFMQQRASIADFQSQGSIGKEMFINKLLNNSVERLKILKIGNRLLCYIF